MKKHLRFFTSTILFVLLFVLCIINWRLHYLPETKIIHGDTVNDDAICQLRNLRDAMDNNAATEMQTIYPEGFIFFNALYGLSWCELAETVNKNSDLYKEAHNEIQRACNNINSEQGRIIFDSALPLPYGAFYNGWSTYLLGKKLRIESPEKRNTVEEKLFKERCERIAKAIDRQTYPETYYGNTWPADVVICVAALALHDKIFTPAYDLIIKAWITEVKMLLDDEGLFPHSVNSVSGKSIENARGSSISLMLCFLPEIDQGLIGSQFRTYYSKYADRLFGLYGIREYPEEINGMQDIDSGPVIFGMGGAATIVGMRVMKIYGYSTEAIALRNGVEVFAFPIKYNGRKKYLFGKLPIADVFIAWGQGPYNIKLKDHNIEYTWRTQFHIYSLIIATGIMLLLTWMWKKSQPII